MLSTCSPELAPYYSKHHRVGPVAMVKQSENKPYNIDTLTTNTLPTLETVQNTLFIGRLFCLLSSWMTEVNDIFIKRFWGGETSGLVWGTLPLVSLCVIFVFQGEQISQRMGFSHGSVRVLDRLFKPVGHESDHVHSVLLVLVRVSIGSSVLLCVRARLQSLTGLV